MFTNQNWSNVRVSNSWYISLICFRFYLLSLKKYVDFRSCFDVIMGLTIPRFPPCAFFDQQEVTFPVFRGLKRGNKATISNFIFRFLKKKLSVIYTLNKSCSLFSTPATITDVHFLDPVTTMILITYMTMILSHPLT